MSDKENKEEITGGSNISQIPDSIGKVSEEAGKSLADLNWAEPSEEKKEEWRKKYGKGRIKSIGFFGPVPGTDIPMIRFIFRCINRKEYREVMFDMNLSPEQREDKMCQELTLWPEGINFSAHFGEESEKAGTPTMLLEGILNASGFQGAVEVGNV